MKEAYSIVVFMEKFLVAGCIAEHDISILKKGILF